ncbi:MAG: nucleoside recognition domain-containing protein [Myxococcota bacterium]|jgi:spore maturation protein SpmA|nr:spore maturation protein [Deltaproteobacteria bacterium]MCP4241246.1 spore maturation protein [bacterium]MDP6074708.1 nucleoside recognition domain-containing protein [Myxococcota bacterium]MDP6243648.1 nucleoside recognition domain-containing protein [Myxococcota bacterium]MDP7073044.1 nucleoside recognition domain-containing protein [Myxococcota bacterium]
MLNAIWLGLMLGAVLYAAFAGNMQAVTNQIFESAASGVTLVIELTGIMIFMLGLMRVAQDGGAMRWIALRLAPVMRRLFPEVPADHPAMSAMLMNFTSNIFGLGNAATPFGLKAMAELGRLNPVRGVASNPMILFLAINTSAITLMPPNGTIAVRAAAGSADPFAIWLPTLIATLCSTAAAVAAFYLLRDRKRYAVRPLEDAPENAPVDALDLPAETDVLGAAKGPVEPWRKLVLAAVLLALAVGLALGFADLLSRGNATDATRTMLQAWLFPLLVSALLLIGFAGRVRVYESAIAGAREGLSVVVRIIPYLVLILVAVGMFRASGALDLLIRIVDPVTSLIGIPGEVLPMALLRPLSGSGAFAVMSEILTEYGPDSFVGLLASTLQGSTETTFYVLTLYAGAAGVRDVRFALIACLCGDFAGLLGATAACHLFFG